MRGYLDWSRPSPFQPHQLEAWQPPEQLTVSEWADKYRILTLTAMPGPYRTSRAEYCRGVMDALSDREHLEVWVQKPAQTGLSEVGRNWIAWGADVDPGPVLIVFPDEQSAREMVTERIMPMLEDTPRLTRLKTGRPWDLKTSQIHLRTCSMHIVWSGSPSKLASRPIRRCFFDEVDKYAKWRGVEADPISLGKVRTITYRHRRKIFGISTPTIPDGTIVKQVRACGDIRRYHLLCPHCNELDLPHWNKVVWEGRNESDEDTLQEQRSLLEIGELPVRYKCGHCEGLLDQRQVDVGVKLGAWVSDDHPPGEHPRSNTLGFIISGIVSPWVGPTELAIRYTSAKLGGLQEMQDFYNSYLGEPFWDSEAMGDSMMAVAASSVWNKSQAGHPQGDVPAWAQLILCGADSKGKAGHQYVIRAFGDGYRSRLIEYGETDTSDELYQRVFRDFVDPSGRVLRCRRLCVDVGGSKGAQTRDVSRTDEIYRWCKTDPAHLWGVKGHGGSTPPSRQITTSTQTYHPPGENRKSYDVTVSVIDTEYFKDLLASRINSEDATLWEIPAVGRDYVRQIASERKILAERRIKGEQVRDIWRWVPRSTNAENHYWDAEVYCTVAAYMLDMDRPRTTKAQQPPKAYLPKYGHKATRRPSARKWKVGR